jgi:hypothetical protein
MTRYMQSLTAVSSYRKRGVIMTHKKADVFQALSYAAETKYRGITITIEVNEWRGSARFVATLGDDNITNDNLKNLLRNIDRRLGGAKARIDLPVLYQRKEWTVTTIGVNGDVNMITTFMGSQHREQVAKYYVERKLAKDSEENRVLYDAIEALEAKERRLTKKRRALLEQVKFHTYEEIKEMVDAKTEAIKKKGG